jgi:hypothetical protein
MPMQGPWWGESQIAETMAPSVIALGDSWFWYPLNNLINPLQKLLNASLTQPILVLGANGAEAEEFTGDTYRGQLLDVLDRRTGFGRTVRAVFLSGGGNDVAGTDDLPALLRSDCSGAQAVADCFRPGEPQGATLRATRFLLDVHDSVQAVLPGTPVVLHGYDYAQPTGEGFLGLGQWLKDPMDRAGVPARLQVDVVAAIIDAFAAAQEALMSPTFLPIDTRGTLTAGQWANELHPTPGGFNKLGRRWREPLRLLGLI